MPTVTNHFLTQSTSLLGCLESLDQGGGTFQLRLRDGKVMTVVVAEETFFGVLSNLDGVDRDSLPGIADDDGSVNAKMRKYLAPGHYVCAQGILQQSADMQIFVATRIHLMHPEPGRFLFEETHWWLSQIDRMADQWLSDLFRDERDFEVSDFSALYRTNLGLHGQPTDDDTQVMATLARLIYGLSSAYLLRGKREYIAAAKAGVDYQRSMFRNLSHDGRYCFWSYGRKKLKNGAVDILPSQSGDDMGTIALYEQIYALAGLTQYFRVTGDPDVLNDIRRTVTMFNQFFLDEKHVREDLPGEGGYFSHIDPANMRPDSSRLGNRRLRKNWNSIGDHIPAYLVNLLLALDPLPTGSADDLEDFVQTCREILNRCVDLILDKFPDPDPEIPYVRERFHADWSYDAEWGWQKDRAIVGHNLKIAWNLTRCANYYESKDPQRARRCIELAEKLAQSMKVHGLDLPRGGCYDAVERKRGNVPVKFVWGNTKDFWQQEQGILAYLILYGYTRNSEYLDLARDMSAFWNQFFLDRTNVGVWFRLTESGTPVVEGDYVNKATYAVAGYHSFELNFLAHIYMRLHVSGVSQTDNSFCLFFRPRACAGVRSLSVLPDFVKPGEVHVTNIWINGRAYNYIDRDNFRIPISDEHDGAEVIVQFVRSTPDGQPCQRSDEQPRPDDTAPASEETDVLPHQRCAGL
ncbi:AGE family epimerase/isomerase [Blastopirellula marina]|nr:AGE family epimerase/isomerase [Blastopirellula marina]